MGKQKSFGRYAAPVAACMVLCIGTTAAAKALLWDKYVAEKYNIESDEQTQEKMVEGDWELSSTSVAKVFEQVKAGTYQGEYMEIMDWYDLDTDTHVAVDPWDIYIQYEGGSYFTPENNTGYTTDTEDAYIIVVNYIGYLNLDEVEAIQFGDCVIPLSDGAEQ